MCLAPSCHLCLTSFLVGVLLGLLAVLLPRLSDACGHPPKAATMHITGDLKPAYRPGDRVTYSCHPGLKPVPGLHSYILCQKDNTWTELQEACTPKKCPPLGVPNNGKVKFINGAGVFGSVAHVSCDEGFYIVGSKTLRCDHSGNDVVWNDTLPNCIKKKCPTLGDPNNGRVDFVKGAGDFGSEALVTCDDGFHLTGGSSELRCELSGGEVTWSHPLPQCQKVQCTAPAQIPNGNFTNSHKDTFDVNEVVTYTCDASHEPDLYLLVGEDNLTCSDNGEWNRSPPECKVVNCKYPVVDNGRPIAATGGKFYYEATITFECLDGFNLSGQSTVSCGADSTWVPGLPTCLRDPNAAPAPAPLPTSSAVTSQPGTRPLLPSPPPPPPLPADASPGVRRPCCRPQSKDSKRLDAVLTVLFILDMLATVAVTFAFIARYLQKRKKGETTTNPEPAQDKPPISEESSP